MQLQATAFICHQLAAMIGAGIEPAEAFSVLADVERNRVLRSELRAAAADLREGVSVSEAFARRPHLASPSVVVLLQGGEEAQLLPQMLHKVGEMLSQQAEAQAALRAAYRRDALMIAALVAVIFVGRSGSRR